MSATTDKSFLRRLMDFISKSRRKSEERRRFRDGSRNEVFSWIYKTNKWGCAESRSGKGSDLIQSERLRDGLPELLRKLNVSSILDLPCGDLNWMKQLDLSPYQYIGADIVGDLIEKNRRAYSDFQFEVLDVCSDPLPAADFMLSRDLLVHLCFADINLAVENIRASSIRFLACTTFTEVHHNKDKLTGNHRMLNMLEPPFSWGEPLYLLPDGARGQPPREGKSLGVWKVANLPKMKEQQAGARPF